MTEPTDVLPKTLNAAQVKALFEENCCLCGHADGVTAAYAAELFGVDAIHKVVSDCKANTDFCLLKFGERCSEVFLYLSGFEYAATVSNVIKLSGHRPVFEKEWEKKPKGKLVDFPDGEKRKRGNA